MNDTPIEFGNETNVHANVTKTINWTEGLGVGWRWYSCDQSNNCNETGIYNITVFSINPASSGAINNSFTTRHTFASMNATITDAGAIANATFSWNNSGLWINDSVIVFDNNETSVFLNISKTLNQSEGIGVGWRWYFSDASGNVNETGIYNITVFSINPTSNNPQNNSNTTRLQFSNMNVSINDTGIIANSTFSWNDSGAWVNDTAVFYDNNETGVFPNITKTVTQREGLGVGWRFYFSDVSGNMNETGIYNLTLPLVNPTFSGQVNESDIVKDRNITMNITLSDNVGLANYTFSWNDTGSYVNDTALQISTNKTNTFIANTSKQITASEGTIVTWRYYACDTSARCNTSDNFTFTVAPTFPSSSSPVNSYIIDSRFITIS